MIITEIGHVYFAKKLFRVQNSEEFKTLKDRRLRGDLIQIFNKMNKIDKWKDAIVLRLKQIKLDVTALNILKKL